MRIFLALLFIACCGALSAQINESDTLLLQHYSALTGNAQTGNYKAFALRAKLDIAVAPSERYAIKTQNTYRYQSFFGRKVDNEFATRNFVYLYQHHRVYPFAMAFLSGNFRRKIDFRYFAGAGATWQMVRRKNQVLKLSVSGVFESTLFAGDTYNYPEYNGATRLDTWRATFRLFGKHALIRNKVRLYYEAYYQPSLQKRNNHRWHTELGVDVPVWKGLSINGGFMYDHENVTIFGVKPNDLIATFGVSYTGNLK